MMMSPPSLSPSVDEPKVALQIWHEAQAQRIMSSEEEEEEEGEEAGTPVW